MNQPIARPLTSGETALSQSIFKTAIDYSCVRIHNHSYLPFNLQFQNTAMAPNGHIYFTKTRYCMDFSKENIHLKHWFIHEMTHVWQYQCGYPVKFRGAFRFKLPYTYQLDYHKQLCHYNMEAQAELLADYYVLKYHNTPCALRMPVYTPDDLPLYETVLQNFITNPSNHCHLPKKRFLFI